MGRLNGKYARINKPVKASLWFMICGFLQRGISVLTTPIFTRILSTEQYGIYNTFSAWLEVLTVIVTLKLAAGVYTQGLIKYENDRDVFTSSLLGLSTASIIIWFIIYLSFQQLFNKLFEASSITMIAMFVMMWASISLNFWAWKERVEYKYKQLVTITIIVSLAKPILGILAVLATPEKKGEARIVSLAVVELLAYSWIFIKLMKQGRVFYHKKYWTYALKFNIPLIPHYLSKNILNHSDRIMITGIVGAGASGIYSLAYNLSSLLTILNTSITNSLTPWIYKSIKSNEIKKIKSVSNGVLLIVALSNLLLIAIAPEAIQLFAPSAYSEAIWTIPPVTMAVFFQFLYSLFSLFEFYYEKTKWIMVASITGAILNIVLNYAFIPVYGYIAAAYTTLFCYMIYSALHLFFMRRVCKKHCQGAQPYGYFEIVIITCAFLLTGFGLMALFPFWYARYTIVAITIVIGIAYRKQIINLIKTIKMK